MVFGLKPEIFGGKKKKHPILRFNDFLWAESVGMPLRGARNLLSIGYGAADIGFNKVIKPTARSAWRFAKEETFPSQETVNRIRLQAGKGPSTPTVPSRSTTKTPSTADQVVTEESEKAKWLKKTSKSPAAAAGVFTDEERWALQQKHRKWLADRAAGKLKTKNFDPRKGRNQRR